MYSLVYQLFIIKCSMARYGPFGIIEVFNSAACNLMEESDRSGNEFSDEAIGLLQLRERGKFWHVALGHVAG